MNKFGLAWRTFCTIHYVNELNDFIKDHETKNLTYKLRNLIPFRNEQNEYLEAISELRASKKYLENLKYEKNNLYN